MSTTDIVLGARLDLEHSLALHQSFIDALGSDVVLDGREVVAVDTSALQLLVAFFRSNPLTGGRVSWREPSEALVTSARRLGLDGVLGLPVAAR